MKYLFLPMLVVISFSSFAQSLEVGVNGGVLKNTLPYIDGRHPGYYEDRTAYSYGIWYPKGTSSKAAPAKLCGGISLFSNTKNNKWQLGISASMMNFSYSLNYAGTSAKEMLIAKPAIPVNILLNRRFHFEKTEVYGGVGCGYVFVKVPDDPDVTHSVNSRVSTVNEANGYTLGAQAGATYSVTKRFGINAETNLYFVRLRVRDATFVAWEDHLFYTYSATIGVRYRFTAGHSKERSAPAAK